MHFATLNAEPDGDEIRVETHAGRDHLVAPVVMVREGVLNGGLLPFDAIAESVPGWNGRPVTAPPDANSSGHPVDEDGNFTSANEAEYLESMRVGFIQAAEATDDLPATNDDSNGFSRSGARAEVWVDVVAAEEVGESAVEAVRRMAEGEPLDVSTGYFHKAVERGGSFNGERYDHEQFGLIPDHLALLPNERGACSWEDGCGTPRVNIPMDSINATDGDRVRWESDGNARYGIVVEGDSDDGTLVGVYEWNDGEWERGDDTVKLSEESYEVIDQLPSEPAGNVSIDADPATLSERMTHAAHILTGQAAGCSCGGHADEETDTETQQMNDDEHEALAEATGLSVETLADMDDDEVESLKSTMDANAGGGDGDGGAPDDEPSDEVAALREEIQSLSEQVEDLTEQNNADPEAEAAREYLAENTDRDAEALAEWPDEAVVETASARGFRGNYAAPHGDRINRIGQAGAPSESSEDDTAALTENVGALAAMSGEEEN